MADQAVALEMAVRRLTECGIPHFALRTGDATVLVVERGGRVLGPFFAGGGSMNWLPEAWQRQSTFADLIASDFWNIGGERVWIGPEIQYMIPDRTDYWGSYDLPSSMDPGVFRLSLRNGLPSVGQRLTLTAYGLASGTKELHQSISVAPCENPLRNTQWSQAASAVQFAGYRQTVELCEMHSDDILSESWNLYQVHPGGRILIPATEDVEVSDYYEPVGEMLEVVRGGVAVTVSGDKRFKIGVKSPHVFGRVGYRNVDSDGQGYLLIRNFLNDPSSVYAEQADVPLDRHGDSVHVYNDDGGLGGFGEMEVRGRTIGGPTGRINCVDEFTLWCFRGTDEALAGVQRQLLGMGNE